MLAAHHCCSEYRWGNVLRFKNNLPLLSLGALVALGGCNVSKGLDLQSVTSSTNQIEKSGETVVQKLSTKPAKRPEVHASKAAKASVAKSTNSYAGGGLDPSVGETLQLSARCRYLLASTGIETTILRSPTVSAEANDEGQVGGSISYDLVDLRRANLKDDLALAQCRRNFASTRIAQLLGTSPQSLSRAGYLAQANALQRSRPAFNQIDREITQSVNNGLLTIQLATVLRQLVNQVKGQESRVRGEAARREVIDGVQIRSVAGLDKELVASEEEIHRLQKELRTTDAVKLSLSGGYSVDAVDDNQILEQDGDLYAKVKVSVRLGAFRNQRYELEDEAQRARIDGLYERNTGTLWRAGELGRANQRALSSLYEQRRQLKSAIAQANRNSNVSATAYESEVLGIALRAKISKLSLQAELVGLNATIADTLRIEKKLRFQ